MMREFRIGDAVVYSMRPATEADYWYCYKLTKRNMYDLFCKYWGGWVSSEFRKGFVFENTSMVIVKKRRAGFFSVIRNADGLFIDNIQLSPSVSGKGIGTDILARFLAKHGDGAISLGTFMDNPARRLYERLGFVITENKGGVLKMVRNPGGKAG